jgi:outer membrane protein assembly factor BamB
MKYHLASLCCLTLLINARAAADDWPMWRHDAGRTGATEMEFPASMDLQWVRDLPPIEPAYHNSRLQFDAGYEPVASGGRVLFASSLTDSVTALDAATGRQLWIYRTDGPVRFAPAVSNDSVCFGSDDGHLYCVDLESGSLRWKYRAVPSERRLLGNRRLISVWPIRGGPVAADGVVYFAAGVWPFEGVFVYALKIETGDVIWRNESLGYRFAQQPHNTQAIGGLAPQGYLVADGDDLTVPCSTAYPALLNRYTGELVEFELPSPGRFPGGWFAAIDAMSSREFRRGKITFDNEINRQQHEDKLHKGYGVSGISRTVRVGDQSFKFDEQIEGVEGTVHSIIAADERMIVSTREGKLYCFAAADPAKPMKLRDWQQPIAELTIGRTAVDFVDKLLAESASPYGYALVVGLHDGSVAKSLVRESKYHVVAFDDDPQRVDQLRRELELAGVYGTRAAVIQSDLGKLELPPYIATLITTERPDALAGVWPNLLQTLRPFGGVAATRIDADMAAEVLGDLRNLQPGNFELDRLAGQALVRRVGSLPGTTEYGGNWTPSPDELVRFPLGVLWFDDTLGHFKRSPQPRFTGGVMISRPKNWHLPRFTENNSVDYPLLPPVLSDIYTGRVLDESEQPELRSKLTQSDPSQLEPSQYRPPRQNDDWKPNQPVAGRRTNPLTGLEEPRAFPKTYGCDGGVDYGSFYTLRAGTPAFYDKTLESGTVFLSGPRSGCTNSVIPAGGLLNVPYFYEGCTCSYPLPTALSLFAMPESYEQWSSWGDSEPAENTIQRIALNFAAPGDRMTRDGTLWLDYPSIGGPSPKVDVTISPSDPSFSYRHSIWMAGGEGWPWVTASTVQRLQQLTLDSLKPGRYSVRLFFAEPADTVVGKRVQDVSLQGRVVLRDLDVQAEAGGSMRGIVRQIDNVDVHDALTLDLSATKGDTLISGIEIIRQP